MPDGKNPAQPFTPNGEKTRGAGPRGWTPPAPEEISRLLPNYHVLSLLGRGGMGAVYLAVQTGLDREVAIKVLPLEVSADPDFADRFEREARALAKLSHPHIVAVHDFGKTSEGHLYIVMEYVDGANLDAMIHGPGLAPAQALHIAAQVCEALAYAHELGVVHRDIKPAKVMVDQSGRAKVTDFGLARLTDPTAEHLGSTMMGSIMGTPDYMAPEQKKGMQVDHRADIYSVGVMLYEMLCGEVPRGVFEPPSRRVECDPRVDQVVTRAMQQEPRLRYQSTQEMKTDVDAARTPLEKAESKTSRTRVAAIVATCLVLVSAAVFFLWEKVNLSRAARAQAAAKSSPAPQREPAADGLKPANPMLTAAPAAPTVISAPAPAQAGEIVTFAGHRYQFVTGDVSWTAAKAKAESMGGHLATITTKEEDTWLKKTFDALIAEPAANCWLGGYAEDKTAPWRWITGEPFDFQDWHPSEPNYDYGPGNPAPPPYAIHFHREGRWQSTWWESPVRFNRISGYIVEWDTANEPAKAEAAPPLGMTVTTAPTEATFVNALGMKFVPVPILGGPTGGQRVLFSVWDTRVQDYEVFARDTQRDWKKPEFEQGPTHPAVNVTWDDATAFCAWLTERERKAGKLGANERYRLPSDHEWSCAAGIGEQEDAALTPEENEQKNKGVFPWGRAWPPPEGAGNYAGEEVQPLVSTGNSQVYNGLIAGYRDGYTTTSPVGSFAANRFGLYDLNGNVWQWVEDRNEKGQISHVRRGAAWTSAMAIHLKLSHRHSGAALWLRYSYGFRCVLASSATTPTATPAR